MILAALAALVMALTATEAAVAAGPPGATTNPATKITSTSATLNATVFANKSSTTYAFDYGTTNAYGAHTATAGPVSGNSGKAVHADVAGLTPGTTYHFRVVATSSAGVARGADATFVTAARGTNAVTIAARPAVVTFGGASVVSGVLTGPLNAHVKVTLEANPAPYTAGFKPSATTTTGAMGAYSLSVTPSATTHYRVVAKTKPEVTSPIAAVTVRVKVGMRLSTRTPTFRQLVTFSGTVTPAHNGKVVAIQRRTSTGTWTTVATQTLVAAAPVNGVAVSSYSRQMRLVRNATYRARMTPADGDHAIGTSLSTTAKVRVRVGLRLSDSTPRIGQLVRFSGAVAPAHNGRIAAIQRRTSTGGWTTVAHATLIAAAPIHGITMSRYSRLMRLRSNATYRVLLNPNDGDHITGTSAGRSVSVHL